MCGTDIIMKNKQNARCHSSVSLVLLLIAQVSHAGGTWDLFVMKPKDAK